MTEQICRYCKKIIVEDLVLYSVETVRIEKIISDDDKCLEGRSNVKTQTIVMCHGECLLTRVDDDKFKRKDTVDISLYKLFMTAKSNLPPPPDEPDTDEPDTDEP